MMKSNRTTIVYLVLFFGLMLTLWGLDVSGVRPRSERERRADRVLPDLIDTPEAEIRRVEVDRGRERLAFERRDDGPGRWQMVEPRDVAAEPARLEALVRNLRELRKDPEAGAVSGDPASYGLAPPAATIRLYAGAAGSAAAGQPVAALEVGKEVRDRRYVRPVGGGIEVVGARLLGAVDRPMDEWRQPNVMGVPTFQVASVAITRRDRPDSQRLIRAERTASGRWRLTAPIQAPADTPKVESLLGAIASLRVAEPPKGYVADDIKDAAPFGLDRPPITVELTTQAGRLTLDIGKPVPDDPERVYVRQGGQDDVVMVEGRALAEIPADAVALRSKQVADIVPTAVAGVEIQTRSDLFALRREGGRWELTSPLREPADAQTVQAFLAHIDDLQASEFLDPEKARDPMLDPPVMTIRVRQPADGRRPSGEATAEAPLALELKLGRHDILRKTVFGQLPGDRVILALPDKLLDVLPKNPLAFRDRSIVADRPDRIKKLVVRRGERVDEVVPAPAGTSRPNAWEMLRPVKAPADAGAVTQVIAALCSLRAQDYAAPSVGDERAFGLDRPVLRLDWESDGSHWLKVGAPVPQKTLFYATRDGQPAVFTLPAATVRLFDVEYHDHRAMTFPLDRARRVVLRFPHRTIALRHRPPQARGQVEWVAEEGSDAEGFDLSRIGSLVQTLARLETTRFIQYEGPIPPETGLTRPRLTVEVALAGKDPVRHVLRIGSNTDQGNVCAATGTEPAGPAFFLPGPPWNELIRSGDRFPQLPDDVFAPR